MTTHKTTVADAFGLRGDAWMRHANPASVWTRFATLPFLVLATWSRDWIGWWALVPIGLGIVWLGVNPKFFRPPTSTKSWASRSVLGERIRTEGDRATFPEHLRKSKVPVVAVAVQSVATLVMVYGLVTLDPVAAGAGLLFVQAGKVWFLDSMVRLFDAMKEQDPRYAAWDY